MTQTLVLIGFKSCGKSTYGPLLADRLGGSFADLDRLLEGVHEASTGVHHAAHEIFRDHGSAYFAGLEASALAELCEGGTARPTVLATTGATPLTAVNLPWLRRLGPLILLDTPRETIQRRWLAGRLPAFIDPLDVAASFKSLYDERAPMYRAVADAVVATGHRTDTQVLDEIGTIARRLSAAGHGTR